MRKSIFMYLFLFAVLFIIFQYMNEKTIYESQDKKITNLSEKAAILEIVNDSLQNRVLDLNYFSLQGNEKAMTYFENIGMDPAKVESTVADQIYDQNLLEGGNPLIPYEGIGGTMQINKLKFLNHRWVAADFSDGTYWGDLIIEYFFDENNTLQLTTVASTLYGK